MKTSFRLALSMMLLAAGQQVNAAEFYPFPDPDQAVEVIYPGASGPYFPEANLVQGPGFGFNEEEPHEKLLSGQEGNWVTLADCGYPADYVECVGEPIILLDLGKDVLLDEISTWGYAGSNANGMREFGLRFATSAEGKAGFGTSIKYNPSFLIEDFLDFTEFDRSSFPFSETVTARYVEMTVTDNFYEEPGNGTGENGWPPGGDRVGIGEIAFRVPTANPDPLAPLENGTLVDPTARANYVHTTLKTWVGDSNLDGLFNSADLVSVFAVGEYEDTVATNSGWRDGDWNGDKEFNSSDFVTAFSDGGYEAGPRPAVAAVPEPSTGWLILLVGGLLYRRSRR